MSHHRNLVRLRAVSNALAELNERVVFVGGTVLSLYADDPAATEPRPTDDIDIIVEVATYSEYVNRIEERLRELGFVNDSSSSVLCRYKVQGLIVDVMPTDSSILGFSNRWYKEGSHYSTRHQLDHQHSIRLLSAPYFIATKFEAFKSHRHGKDPRLNSDFEDIIYLFDNRNVLKDEITQSTDALRTYIQVELAALLERRDIDECIWANLERVIASQRTQRILQLWREIIA